MSKVLKVGDAWQVMGFKRKPFINLSRTNPFLTETQRQQLKLLEELVREGGHLLLLLGVSGVGKTTFLNVLKKKSALPSEQGILGLCEMQGDHGVTVAMIKTLLAKHLAIADILDDTFMPSLRARLVHLSESKQRFLLIIDDAHELPAETVRFLLDVVSELEETEQSLSVLLAGRLQLEHLCVNSVSSEWNTGSSFTIVLQPLGEEDVVNYIRHGLRQAGYRGVMPFSKAQFLELSRDSKGILARLLVMVVDILEKKGRAPVSGRWNLATLFKKNKVADTEQIRSAKGNRQKVIIAAVAVAVMLMLSIGLWHYSAPKPTVIAANQGEIISVEKQGQWIKTVIKPEGQLRMADTAAQIEPVVQPIPVATPPVISSPVVATRVEKKPTQTTPFKAEGYTIQIAGAADLITLQKTVCQVWTRQAKQQCQGLPRNLHYVHTQKDNQDWYIATMGQYKSSAEARGALRQLPAQVQKNTPWVRAFAEIPNLTVVALK